MRTVSKEELKDYRLRVLVRGRKPQHRHRCKNDSREEHDRYENGAVLRRFQGGKDRNGQDLLDDLWEEIMWFVTPEKVKRLQKSILRGWGKY